MMVEAVLFIVGSVGALILSWPSLGSLRRHGFYRFFAFEGLLSLLLLNKGVWFLDPLVPRQVLSWVLLAASLMLAVHGFYLLVVAGRPASAVRMRNISGSTDGVLETTRLVVTGAYRYIRHPLYASLLLLTWGIFLKGPSLLAGALTIAVSAFLVATARVEEAENVRKFGDEYVAYMRATRMFLPWIL